MAEQEVLGIPFANNPHPMWIWDLETLAFLDVNDAAEKAYGYSRREFLAMKVLDIRPPEDRQKFLEEINPRHRISRSTAERWRHKRKEGEIFEVTITSWALTFQGRRAELVIARSENINLVPGPEKSPLAGSTSQLVPD